MSRVRAEYRQEASTEQGRKPLGGGLRKKIEKKFMARTDGEKTASGFINNPDTLLSKTERALSFLKSIDIQVFWA